MRAGQGTLLDVSVTMRILGNRAVGAHPYPPPPCLALLMLVMVYWCCVCCWFCSVCRPDSLTLGLYHQFDTFDTRSHTNRVNVTTLIDGIYLVIQT